MSAEKVLAQVVRLEMLLRRATQIPWVKNGTLIGPGLEECDASTDEEEPSGWIYFKTEHPDADRALWICLTDNASRLLELKRAAAEWAVALHEIHQKVFTGPGPHLELERFQERERRLAEIALVVLEGIG